jgi:hypothetical protein
MGKALLLGVLVLAMLVDAQLEWGTYVAGQFYAQPLAGAASLTPLNAISQLVGGQLLPLAEGVFTSGTVERMVLNGSSIIVGGSFQWTRCNPRSCKPGDSAFTSGRVLRNLAVFDLNRGEWDGIGLGCAGYINDVAVYGPNVVVGGSITQCFNAPGTAPSEKFVNNIGGWTAANGWIDLGGEAFKALAAASCCCCSLPWTDIALASAGRGGVARLRHQDRPSLRGGPV